MWKKDILRDKAWSSLIAHLASSSECEAAKNTHQIMIEDLKNAITGQTEYVELVEGLTIRK